MKASSGSSFAENRYFNQLRVLVQLRNLKNQFNEAMESISTFFKEENDSLFYRGEVKGREEGREEEQEKFITYLLEKLGLSDEQAAGIVGVRLELVQKTREKLKK